MVKKESKNKIGKRKEQERKRQKDRVKKNSKEGNNIHKQKIKNCQEIEKKGRKKLKKQ